MSQDKGHAGAWEACGRRAEGVGKERAWEKARGGHNGNGEQLGNSKNKVKLNENRTEEWVKGWMKGGGGRKQMMHNSNKRGSGKREAGSEEG